MTAELMQGLARGLDDILNPGEGPKRTGFALFLFPFDGPEGQRTNYVSNAEREDMITAMKEVLARFEGRRQEGGNA